MCSSSARPAMGTWRACRRYRERAPRSSSPSSTGSMSRCGHGRRNRQRFGCSGRSRRMMRSVAALAAAAALACWCGAAQAYRPFDGTDAAVAAPGEVEIEFGAVEYLREGSERTLFAPNVRLNYGFAPGWEAVLEGELAHGLAAGTSGTRLVGNGAFLKGMLREGSLQEKLGPSIATEFGILLPGIHDERGTGASVAGIVSQQWNWVTVHFNGAVALTREQHADIFIDAIVEGPHEWPVRPAAEFFHELDFGQFQT